MAPFLGSRFRTGKLGSNMATDWPSCPRLKKRGKLANSIFCRTQPALWQDIRMKTEFANPGKLSWQTGKLIFRNHGFLPPIRHYDALGQLHDHADPIALLLAV